MTRRVLELFKVAAFLLACVGGVSAQTIELNVLLGMSGYTPPAVTQYLLHNPTVTRATMWISCADFDTGRADGSGNEIYDWSTLDANITVWKNAGKKANLALW